MYEMFHKIATFSLRPMAKYVEMQELNFKRGATKMFCSEVVGPPTKSRLGTPKG